MEGCCIAPDAKAPRPLRRTSPGRERHGGDALDPVLLDVANATDYYVLTKALEDFIQRNEGEIADERDDGIDLSMPGSR